MTISTIEGGKPLIMSIGYWGNLYNVRTFLLIPVSDILEFILNQILAQ